MHTYTYIHTTTANWRLKYSAAQGCMSVRNMVAVEHRLNSIETCSDSYAYSRTLQMLSVLKFFFQTLYGSTIYTNAWSWLMNQLPGHGHGEVKCLPPTSAFFPAAFRTRKSSTFYMLKLPMALWRKFGKFFFFPGQCGVLKKACKYTGLVPFMWSCSLRGKKNKFKTVSFMDSSLS
jgi:hypothetical protein